MAACLLSLSLSDCWLYCSQLWCRSCGIQITSVISLEALCAWLARADIWYRIDHSPPTLPVPSSYLHLPFILGGWHTRELWDQLSWVELGEAIAGLLHPLTWPPQWAFVRSTRAKPHPSSSNGFWSATGSIRHYCYAWVKATDTQAGRQRRESGSAARLTREGVYSRAKPPPGASICSHTARGNCLHWAPRRFRQR